MSSKFVQFERPDGSPVWVSPDSVSLVSSADEPGKPELTRLTVAGFFQVVKGSAADVVTELQSVEPPA